MRKENLVEEREKFIVKSYIHDDLFYTKTKDLIDYRWLENPFYRVLYFKVKQFCEKDLDNRNIITNDILKFECKNDQYIQKHFTEEMDTILDICDDLVDYSYKDGDKKYWLNNTKNWLKTKKITNIIFDIANQIDTKDETIDIDDQVNSILPDIEEVISINLSPPKINLANDINFLDDLLDNIEQQKDYIRHGMPFFENLCSGTLYRGSVNLVSAPTGKGKSPHLLHHAISHMKCGYNVLYATFELSPHIVYKRYLANYYNLNMDYIDNQAKANKVEFRKMIMNKMETDINNKKGDLIFEEFEMLKGNVLNISNFIQTYERTNNKKIDIIVCDYIGKMGNGFNVNKNVPSYERYEKIILELEWLAKKHNCLVWTASQLRGDANDAEEITDQHLQSSKQIINSVSFFYAFREDKKTKKHKCYILKSRNFDMNSGFNGTNVFLLDFDKKTQRITECDGEIASFTDDDKSFLRSFKETDPIAREFGQKVHEAPLKTPIKKNFMRLKI